MNQDHPLTNINNFTFIQLIGKGTYGRVWKAKHIKTNQIFAIKIISKIKLISSDSIHLPLNELSILKYLSKSSLITNIHSAFQDSNNLYLIIDYINAYSLRYFLNTLHKTNKRLSYNHFLFLTSNIFQCINYIHSKNVIHLDLKPENILLDINGYCYLSDFGLSLITTNKTKYNKDICGTLEYMSPEMILRNQYGKSCDMFSCGVIIYEIVFGYRPYYANSKDELMDVIKNKKIVVYEEQLVCGGKNVDIKNNKKDLICLLNGLLEYECEKRFSIEDVKKMGMFRKIDWGGIERKEVESCLKELISVNKENDNNDIYDIDNVIKDNELVGCDTMERYKEIIKNSNNYNIYFDKYYFVNSSNNNNYNFQNKVNESKQSNPSKINVKDIKFTLCTNQVMSSRNTNRNKETKPHTISSYVIKSKPKIKQLFTINNNNQNEAFTINKPNDKLNFVILPKLDIKYTASSHNQITSPLLSKRLPIKFDQNMKKIKPYMCNNYNYIPSLSKIIPSISKFNYKKYLHKSYINTKHNMQLKHNDKLINNNTFKFNLHKYYNNNNQFSFEYE